MKKFEKNEIIIFPEIKGTHNKYLNNLYKTIKDEYNVIGHDEIKGIIKLLKAQIYHFNWIENDSNYFIKRIFIKILKILNKKVVWTVHNNMPHEGKNKEKIEKFMKFMAKNSDRIHILCTETLKNKCLENYKNKVVYVPMGDYIQNYNGKNVDIYKKYNIEKKKKIILFVGLVRKYKNIELLIHAYNESKLNEENFVLLISGVCSDEEYKKELEQMSNDNIYLDFNFIKDEEMGSYLKNSEILISPYNKISSLNSATLSMAMSYAKTMILPLIGSVKDIKDYERFLYVYDYDDVNEHYEALLSCLKNVKNQIKENPEILEQKGKMAYQYIKNNQTWERLKDRWIKLYKF